MSTCPCCGSQVDRPDPERIVAALPLGPSERPLARFLVSRFGEYVETPDLIDALYRGVAHGGPQSAQNIVNVHVMNIRRKLKPHGITVQKGGWNMRRMTWVNGD